MKDEYIIVNKTAILRRIEELEERQRYFFQQKGGYSFHDLRLIDSKIELLKTILSQSTPLIPEIEKAFDEGQTRMQYEIIEKLGLKYQTEHVSQSTILNMEVHSEEYISNLKLVI